MNAMIDAFINRSRTILTILVVSVIAGLASYLGIPKEADPDIPIPFVMVTIPHQGISPIDAERLLIKPMESTLQTIEGLENLRAFGSQGVASIVLEFDVNFDKDQALLDVREKVDEAKADLPSESEEPIVTEVNASLFPVLVVTISGNLPQRTLYRMAQEAQDEIETVSTVLEAKINGQPEEMLEVVFDPAKLESYNIALPDLIRIVNSNNRLVAAGSLDTGQGRFQVKVPGLFETKDDVLSIPVKTNGDTVVSLSDIASVRRTFKDADSYARFNGEPTIAIAVVKRLGSNILETNESVREVVARVQKNWPEEVSVAYSFDQSYFIEMLIESLQSAIMTAIILVMVLVVAALGIRSGALVGIAIPSSFLIGFFFLGSMGYTINMIVMFGMLLSVGVLVDGAIVVVEYGDRKISEGLDRKEAYALAAKRMFWPIISSTGTTLAAFIPLLLWPGISGKFMSFLPITTIFVLSSSLIVALVFLPVIGSLVANPNPGNNDTMKALAASESGDLTTIPGFTGAYVRFVTASIERPVLVLLGALAISYASVQLFTHFNHGVEYAVDTEPEEIAIIIGARGNLSAEEMRDIVIDVEDRVLAVDGLKTVYSNSGSQRSAAAAGGDGDVPEDTIGRIDVEIANRHDRTRSGFEIYEELRQATSHIPGVRVELRKREQGPPAGKDIQIELTSSDPVALVLTADQIRSYLETDKELIDIEDSRPPPGLEWELTIDREQAGRFGADVLQVGTAVQLVTNGVQIGEYRPDDAEDELEIRARLPRDDRSIMQLDTLRISTNQGIVPLTNFVERRPVPLVNRVERLNGLRILTVNANTVPEVLSNDKVADIQNWLSAQELDPSVGIKFGGGSEDQQESAQFLVGTAFPMSMFLMAIILLTQFNSFYHAMLILSSVVFSTIGVLLGAVLTFQTLSVMMSGTGIIALAGIVVNNNIVLIDTYQRLLSDGFSYKDAIIRTAAQRLRPVFLTTVTTIFGLLPMVFQVGIDPIGRDVTIGGPAGIWFQPLATSIVSGLAFSTILTLVLTPAMLALPAHLKQLSVRQVVENTKQWIAWAGTNTGLFQPSFKSPTARPPSNQAK